MSKNLASKLFLFFPEGRIKNLLRLLTYKIRRGLFFNIQYNIFNDIWCITLENVKLYFKRNPYHVLNTNPLFLKNLPDWKPEIIIDAGAFYGTVGLYLAKKFPDAQVYLLEPDPASFEILNENIRLNKLDNLVLLKKGLWNSDGTVCFSKGKELSSSISREASEDTFSIDTISPATLLADCHEKRIFIKINIEGAELEVLPACIPLWRQNQVQMAVATDHFVNNEFTYKQVEKLCIQHQIPFSTEHTGIYKTTYIHPRKEQFLN